MDPPSPSSRTSTEHRGSGLEESGLSQSQRPLVPIQEPHKPQPVHLSHHLDTLLSKHFFTSKSNNRILSFPNTSLPVKATTKDK